MADEVVGDEVGADGLGERAVLDLLRGLPGVRVSTAGPGDGSPESAWGDSFVTYDPDGTAPPTRQPFATVVTSDYPGFDTSSRLDRPGVFRVNLAVGREALADAVGPAGEEAGEHDPAALDEWLPHPVYATQGWISILCPSRRSEQRLRDLVMLAHGRAAGRHR